MRLRKTIVSTALGAALMLIPVMGVGATNASALLPTSTTVSASPGTVFVGQTTNITATVGFLDLLITPTGSVSFTATDGGPTLVLGSASLSSPCLILLISCTATIQATFPSPGLYSVTASYGGDVLSNPSLGATTVDVVPAPLGGGCPDPGQENC
jgi:hypothetical protein